MHFLIVYVCVCHGQYNYVPGIMFYVGIDMVISSNFSSSLFLSLCHLLGSWNSVDQFLVLIVHYLLFITYLFESTFDV